MSAFDTIRAALQGPWDADRPMSESEYEAVLTALAEVEATVARQGEALRSLRQNLVTHGETWTASEIVTYALCDIDAALAGSDVPPAGETT